MSPVL